MKRNVPFSWIAVFVVLIISVVGLVLSQPQKEEVSVLPIDTSTRDGNFTTMLQNGVGAVLVHDQSAGPGVLIDAVVLSRPGFVVIHKNGSGVPGEIIGSSERLLDGAEQLRFQVKEDLVAGEVYYAVLYADVDFNDQFNAAVDQMLVDAESRVVLMTFTAE